MNLTKHEVLPGVESLFFMIPAIYNNLTWFRLKDGISPFCNYLIKTYLTDGKTIPTLYRMSLIIPSLQEEYSQPYVKKKLSSWIPLGEPPTRTKPDHIQFSTWIHPKMKVFHHPTNTPLQLKQTSHH